MGLALLGDLCLKEAFEEVRIGRADTVIVLENDLHRHGKTSDINNFLRSCKHVIVLDHTNTPTAQQAEILIPAGTFAESDGIIINNEGRAQRFFQVYQPADAVQESWRWLLDIGIATGNHKMSAWRNFEDITHTLAREVSLLKNINEVSPPANFRINGQRIPREPHRFSGRTAMLANINVSEPKPPVDPDSPLSYTMEGFRGQPPSTMIPFFWSAGWNSVQSINKYQQEVGGSLRGGDPGLRIFEPRSNGELNYFMSEPEIFSPMEGKLWMVYLHHIFGSEELSAHAPGVSERSPKAYVLLNADDAGKLQIQENQLLAFEVDGQPYRLPVKTSPKIPTGIAGLPHGLQGLPFVELPAWGILKKE
jgi:NADH-quinone oxidoreductase subunit G